MEQLLAITYSPLYSLLKTGKHFVGKAQQVSFNNAKKAATSLLVLHNCSLNDEVTIQYDAS